MFVNQLLRNVFCAGAILAALIHTPQLGNTRCGMLADRRIDGGSGSAQSLAEVLADLFGGGIVLFHIVGNNSAPPSLAGISGQRTEIIFPSPTERRTTLTLKFLPHSDEGSLRSTRSTNAVLKTLVHDRSTPSNPRSRSDQLRVT